MARKLIKIANKHKARVQMFNKDPVNANADDGDNVESMQVDEEVEEQEEQRLEDEKFEQLALSSVPK